MSEKFKTLSSVMLLLFRNVNNKTEILLQKRFNTGFGDGMWECACAGHVDENESMKQALIREAKEELGIDICMDNLEFGTIIHAGGFKSENTYYDGYFVAKEYYGNPQIMEPEKCSDLNWFDIKNLPTNFLPKRKMGLDNFLNGISYSECDWDYIK